jgi:hypothetical protein
MIGRLLFLARLSLPFAFDGEVKEQEPQAHGDRVKDQITPELGTKVRESFAPGEDLSHEHYYSAKTGKAQYRSENPP